MRKNLAQIVLVTTFIFTSTVAICADGYDKLDESNANKASARSSDYRMDPVEINQLRAQATQEVKEHFAQIPGVKLEVLARNYFSLDDKPVSSSWDLLEAYRTETILYRLHDLLKAKYPEVVRNELVWVWNNVGGVYARLAVVACSFSEYLAFFGTPLKQVGFSGLYPYMDVYDIMVSGKMHSHGAPSAGSFPILYQEGDVSLLKKGESRLYDMDAYTYMIDYGRGQVARAFWQGVIAPYLFVNHDQTSLYNQLRECGGSIFQGIRYRIGW